MVLKKSSIIVESYPMYIFVAIFAVLSFVRVMFSFLSIKITWLGKGFKFTLEIILCF